MNTGVLGTIYRESLGAPHALIHHPQHIEAKMKQER